VVIALLAESLDPARGGAERAIRAMARALARRGEVVLYAPADRIGPPEPGIELVAVDVRGSGASRARALARLLSERARERGGTLVACGKILGADVVWSHGGVHAAARRAAALAGRSALGGAVARAARALRPVERVFDAIERANVEAARRGELVWVALSDRVARDVAARHHLSGVPVVRNGVELARFGMRRDPGARHVRALFVAHAFALKGLDRALRALVHAPSARLEVVGRGGVGPWERLARKLGVASRVVFAGEVGDVSSRLAEVDVLVHPTRYDPCSLVVLEALAASVPVVVSREDGASEIVGEGGFVLDDPDDPREVGERLESLSDPSLRDRLSRAARRKARSTVACAEELLAIIDAISAPRRPVSPR
jgi:UDP-glucose:(heptosyl)LPS alpha-1,3-glucosyltransferase